MSREIKFRVWDKTIAEYQYITLSDLGEDDYYWFDGETSIWFVLYDSTHEQERFMIEQYTGLKGKNGVEIYEGDIVEFEDIVGEVQFLPQQNGYAVITHNSDYRLVGWKYGVIGNIHENKEMLK